MWFECFSCQCKSITSYPNLKTDKNNFLVFLEINISTGKKNIFSELLRKQEKKMSLKMYTCIRSLVDKKLITKVHHQLIEVRYVHKKLTCCTVGKTDAPSQQQSLLDFWNAFHRFYAGDDNLLLTQGQGYILQLGNIESACSG